MRNYTKEYKTMVLDRICKDVKKVDITAKHSQIIDDRGFHISDVSNKYKLVSNKELIMPLVDHFGVDNLLHLSDYGNRKYTVCKIKTGRQFNFGTIENPDIIDELIVCQNSYNK